MNDKKICPHCAKTLVYFQTEKKWHCPTHSFVDPLKDKETYDKVVRLLREQFGIEENIEYVSCKVSGSAHFYKDSKCVYCGKVKKEV